MEQNKTAQMTDFTKDFRRETRLAHSGRDLDVKGGRAVNPPVLRASTILFETLEDLSSTYRRRQEPNLQQYGRNGTATHFALEAAMAELEGMERAALLPSGLSAVAASLLPFLSAGDHILMADTVYGPTRSFCLEHLARFGVETTFYDPRIGADIGRLFRDRTRLVYMESPGSLTFEVQDVPAITRAAKAAGLVTILDNTWATPLFFRAVEHGVDVVVYAATKYIGGHSDINLGILLASGEAFSRIASERMRLGLTAAADDAWLALRGLRTLAVRLHRHQETGLHLARWLQQRPEVAQVLYPALPESPDHALWRRDFTGACGRFGVELQPVPPAALAAFVEGLELFGLGASWGGFESLVLPAHPERHRSACPWKGKGPVMRFHIGLEDPADLIADLEAGFARLSRHGEQGS